MKCRFCQQELQDEFVDLVNAPPSNAFLKLEELNEPEIFYPLKTFVCKNCYLVQIAEYKKANEIFNEEYIYFSSFSKSWLKHSEDYSNKILANFPITKKSLVAEIASNDGYLLQYFLREQIPVLGIEPTKNTANIAKAKGIETITAFFGVELATQLVNQGRKADLLIGNNVLAHVPDINDFVKGLQLFLKEDGFITLEFPHLVKLIEHVQFDTIYHEHFSYFSLHTVEKIFNEHKLQIYDVEELATHGGSLRIYIKHSNDTSKKLSTNVVDLLNKEEKLGILNLDYYLDFQQKADSIKYNLLNFLISQKENGKKIVAYGAAAKGNTLLNYCGIKKDLLAFVVDASPYKQGKFLPGSHIPVVNQSELSIYKPDYILILPWNIKDEIKSELEYVKNWGCEFVIAIPELKIL